MVTIIMNEFENYMLERFQRFTCPEQLKEAMMYSLFSSGKRIRPLLCFAIAEMKQNADYERIFPLAMAIEMVHTYSLIHDDLPSMDNDDMRRGKSANHIVFGEDLAILAGDGLLSQAFEILFELECDSELLFKIANYFTKAIGINGMVGGQALDIKLDTRSVTETSVEDLINIHDKKTGKLFEISILCSAVLMGYPDTVLTKLTDLSNIIGILYQAVDDYYDDVDVNGKTPGIDQMNGKINYLSFMDKEHLNAYIQKLQQQALIIIEEFKTEGYQTDTMIDMLNTIVRSNIK